MLNMHGLSNTVDRMRKKGGERGRERADDSRWKCGKRSAWRERDNRKKAGEILPPLLFCYLISFLLLPILSSCLTHSFPSSFPSFLSSAPVFPLLFHISFPTLSLTLLFFAAIYITLLLLSALPFLSSLLFT